MHIFTIYAHEIIMMDVFYIFILDQRILNISNNKNMMRRCGIFGIKFNFNMLNETLFLVFYKIMHGKPFNDPNPCMVGNNGNMND